MHATPARAAFALLLAPLPLAAAETPAPDVLAARDLAARIPPGVARQGWLRPLDNRAHWDALAASPAGRALLAKAEKLLRRPLPATTEDLYLTFSRIGDRNAWQSVASDRRGRVVVFAVAEALENRGRFVAAYSETARALLVEPTWVMPAHDRSLGNLRGRSRDIDLGSSHLAWTLAETCRLLEPKLDPALRDAVFAAVETRVLRPFDDMAAGRMKPNFWFHGTNNWNPVCLCGVTGAALAVPGDDDARAARVAAAVRASGSYLSGFPADGVSDEGLGYWGYGFGRYVMFAESVRRASGGAADLLAQPKARVIAAAPARQELDAGVWPAFGDCAVEVRPDRALGGRLARRYGLPAPSGPEPEPNLSDLPGFLSVEPAAGKVATAASPALRDWFPDSGILVCRPSPDTPAPRLAAAMKGGHNAESHNHNDNGSYVLTLDGRRIVCDPGGEVYTARTFGPKRYESRLLNGFGHPVPVVGGVLQAPGAAARAIVLDRAESAEADRLVFDLTSGYPAPGLVALTRTFEFRRGASPSFQVSDTLRAARPLAFETAVVTFGSVEPAGTNRWRITEGGRTMLATFSCDTGAALVAGMTTLDEPSPYPRHPVRLGVSLAGPATTATLSVRFTPEPPPPNP